MVMVIMGVSSSGKTTIGKHLSKVMNSIFIDADDYHSEDNLLKMKSGISLNQEAVSYTHLTLPTICRV